MKFPFSQFLGAVALLLLSLNVSAQDLPIITIGDQQVDEGEIIDVDITVTNFNQIVTTNFKLDWDVNVLRYVSLENIALDLSEDDSFNTMMVAEGRINYLYFDNTVQGNDLEDGTPLFTVRMEVVGEEGDQTTFTYTDTEVVDTAVVALDATFIGGTITVGEPNSTLELDELPFGAEVSPNPFSADANVVLSLNIGGEVMWTLSEINGQVIKNGVRDFAPGTQVLQLSNTLFKHTGTYLLKLQSGDRVITRRLLYVMP